MQTLKQLFNEYKKEIEDNPVLVHDFVGKDGFSVYRKRARMLSMPGFRKFMRNNHPEIDVKEMLKDLDTYETIQDEIFCDNIEGAAAGIFTASVIQRLHGLVEQVEQNLTNKTIEVKFDMGGNNANTLQTAAVNGISKGDS